MPPATREVRLIAALAASLFGLIACSGGSWAEECLAAPADPAWTADGIDYAQCARRPCAGDECVEDDDDRQVRQAVVDALANEGLSDVAQVVRASGGGAVSGFGWEADIVWQAGWTQCGQHLSDEESREPPTAATIAPLLQRPAPPDISFEVAAELAASCPNTTPAPCSSSCDRLALAPTIDGVCHSGSVALRGRAAGSVSCLDGRPQPPLQCELPDDWSCDWQSYEGPQCTCSAGGGVSCDVTAPSCWTCDEARFLDGACDAECGVEDPDCPAPPEGGEGESEGRDEDVFRGCGVSEWESRLCG
jgi:hypothetical protein